MSERIKRIVTLLGLGLLCLHFFFVFVYASPLRGASVKLRIVANYYIGPLFHQNWRLFVPAPNVERRLYVRYLDNGNWSSWEDIFRKQINEQRNGLIWANEEEVLGFSLSMVYLSDSDTTEQKLFIREPDNYNFKVVKKAARQYLLNNKRLQNPQKFEIIFSQIAKDYYSNHYYKNLDFK